MVLPIIVVVGAIGTYILIGNLFPQASLSPARNLTGTWETSFSTTFYIQTDFQTGILQDVGSEDREVTWTITAAGSENVVNIEQTFTYSNRQLEDGSGYTPDIPLDDYTGVISSSSLTVKDGTRVVGQFTFTEDLISGTWSDEWSLAYSQKVYTTANALKLTRQ